MKVKLKIASGCTGFVKKPGDIVSVSPQKAKYMIRTGQAVAVPISHLPPPASPAGRPPKPNAKATKKTAAKAESAPGLTKQSAQPERQSSKPND